MDTSHNAGEQPARGQLFRDVDLHGRELARDLEWFSFVRTEAFEELVKAISKGDRSLENQILRRWGIWR